MSSENKRPIRFLVIIQARITSSRFPNKVMQTVNGRTLIKRVWDAAKASWADKVIVAWPERYPDLDENNVLERFRRISREFPSKYIIRLTSDCPLLNSVIINDAINRFLTGGRHYYCNQDVLPDGFDVQVFTSHMLHSSYATHKEHVISPVSPPKYLSVDTKEDLERVRAYARYELHGK